MDEQQIKVFIDAFAASGLDQIEFSQDGWTLRLVRRPAAAPGLARVAASAPLVTDARPDARPTPAAEAPAAPASDVIAPLYGVVHLQPSPHEPPFVVAGEAVKAGQTLCVIEAMKVFNEIRAEFDATVAAVLVSSGQEVDAGQALLRIVSGPILRA